MEYIVTGKEMQRLDLLTSENYLVPPVVLMEQAALGIARKIDNSFSKDKKIFIACGIGNNAGDGIALSRILNQMGYTSHVYYMFGEDKSGSELFNLQKDIYNRYGYLVETSIENAKDYDLIIDAVFGTGLSRNIEGECASKIEKLNSLSSTRASIDISSGVNSDDGSIMGAAFKADITYTVAFKKCGQLLWPGCDYTGRLEVVDMGICKDCFSSADESDFIPKIKALDENDFCSLPKRQNHSNKGTYGKILIIAGSENMSGAAVFAAKAAYRCGSGLVKVITAVENKAIIQNAIPEAVLGDFSRLRDDLMWADAVVIGPGICQSEAMSEVVKQVLDCDEKKVIADADALNILSNDLSVLKNHKCRLIITPHLGEMSRLCKLPIGDIERNIIDCAVGFAKEYRLVCVLKNFRTIIANENSDVYMNLSGNNGMATAGSGDVLSGVIGSLLGQNMSIFDAAVYGAYVHGAAGDAAMKNIGTRAMMASDIIEGLKNLF